MDCSKILTGNLEWLIPTFTAIAVTAIINFPIWKSTPTSTEISKKVQLVDAQPGLLQQAASKTASVAGATLNYINPFSWERLAMVAVGVAVGGYLMYRYGKESKAQTNTINIQIHNVQPEKPVVTVS